MELIERLNKAEAFIRNIPKSRPWLFVKRTLIAIRYFFFDIFLDEFGKNDFEKFVHETEKGAVERVEREHKNRSKWFIIPMQREASCTQDKMLLPPLWGCSVPVSYEVYRHIMSFLYKMGRTAMYHLWNDEFDKRIKVILQYTIILMLTYNNKLIPAECLDIREFFRNCFDYNIRKGDIERFDDYFGAHGETMQRKHMKMQMRTRHRGMVGISTLPPKDDRVTLEPLQNGDLSRVNYRIVTNYEGCPVYYTTYSRKHGSFEKFMRIVYEVKERFKMRRLYLFGDTKLLWTREPSVITEVRYNEIPWSLEQHLTELYHRRQLHLNYYEHVNYEFVVQDPTIILGRRMVVFNQAELVIERRQYRALRILKLKKTMNDINDEFRKRGNLVPQLMFSELYNRFGQDDLQRLSMFLTISFHDEYGLYMVVDKKALRQGSVMDKLCVTTTTTGSQYLETHEMGYVCRNFVKNRLYFETDYWKKHKLLTDLGIHRKETINLIMLLSSYLRYYLLYKIY
jgi:hypothetical protein